MRKRIGPLRAWLDVTSPDVVCLQELKCTDAEFPYEEVRAMGYEALVVGQKSWNGVAILARGSEPVEIRRSLPGDASDKQARYLEAAVNGVVIGCCYMPNGNPQPGPKFDYKLDWFRRFNTCCGLDGVRSSNRPGGRLQRRAHGRRHLCDALVPGQRPAAARTACRVPGAARRRLGGRLAPAIAGCTALHVLELSAQSLAARRGAAHRPLVAQSQGSPALRGAGVDRAVRGLEGASDHAPAWVELKA